jgi:hypothetical protein
MIPCHFLLLRDVHPTMTRAFAAISLSVVLAASAAAADDEHQLIHVGVMVGPSLPRPLDGEVFVKLMDLVSVGFSYSDFPNFVADPLLSAVGANNGNTKTRLDDFSAYEADLRVYPFQGAFFVGSSIGHQSAKGAVTVSTAAGTRTGTADVKTIYATPRVGFLWAWSSGFLLGVDAGVQLKLSEDRTIVIPPDADAFDPNVRKNINNFVDAMSVLPSFHFRIGWQY